jgi:hypothetical protein
MLTLHFIDPDKHSDAIEAIDAGAAWRTSDRVRGRGKKKAEAAKHAKVVEEAFKIFLEEFRGILGDTEKETDFVKASAEIFMAVHNEHRRILYPYSTTKKRKKRNK